MDKKSLKKILKAFILIVKKEGDITFPEINEILGKYGYTFEDFEKLAGLK